MSTHPAPWAPSSRADSALAVEDRLYSALAIVRVVVTINMVGLNAYRRDNFEHPTVGLLVVVALALTALVGYGLYYTVTLVRLRGATVGKLAAGVRVRAWDRDGRPTWAQAFGRWVTREAVQVVPVIGLPYWVLDSFWLLWDQRRQCLHDKLPGTVVVRAR